MESNSVKLIVGLAGLSGVGKTTTAEMMVRVAQSQGLHLARLSFADPVKNIARTVFGWDGQKTERGRRLLQLLGTDVGRWWREDFWVDQWMSLAHVLLDEYDGVIADDVRFQNEVDAIRNLGGRVARLHSIERGLAVNGHASETQELQVDYAREVALGEPPDSVAAELFQWARRLAVVRG